MLSCHATRLAGNAEQAEASLRVLLSSGERVEAGAFNSLISLHAKNGTPFRAEAILILMGQVVPPVRPTLVTFNSLASAHSLLGDVDATERILAQAAGAPFNFHLDRYSYGAMLQAVSKQRDAAKGKREDPKIERARSEKARTIVSQLWASGVAMNDYLECAVRRALGGQRQADQLRAEFDARRSEQRASARRPPGIHTGAAAMPPAAAAAPGSAPGLVAHQAHQRVTRSKSPSREMWRERAWTAQQQRKEEDDDVDDDDDEEEEEDDDDGWTTVPAKKGRGGKPIGKANGKAKALVSPANKTIKKTNPSPAGLRLTRNRSSEVLDPTKSASPSVLRVVGLPLTRSRSATQRSLLALAEDAVAADANGELGSEVSMMPDIPLKRSAASQLALDLESSMDF